MKHINFPQNEKRNIFSHLSPALTVTSTRTPSWRMRSSLSSASRPRWLLRSSRRPLNSSSIIFCNKVPIILGNRSKYSTSRESRRRPLLYAHLPISSFKTCDFGAVPNGAKYGEESQLRKLFPFSTGGQSETGMERKRGKEHGQFWAHICGKAHEKHVLPREYLKLFLGRG